MTPQQHIDDIEDILKYIRKHHPEQTDIRNFIDIKMGEIRSRPAPSPQDLQQAATAAREQTLNEVSMILGIENESEEYKKIETLRTQEQPR